MIMCSKIPFKPLSLALVSALAAACAAEPGDSAPSRLPTDAEVEQYNALVPPEERIVCRRERQVTSTIPRRVCRLVVDVEETSIFHREQLRRVLR